MCTEDRDSCRRIQTAIKLFVHRDGPTVHRDLFRHSLPNPTPTDKQDIIDIILQIVLMLLEEFKPEPAPEPDPDDTMFPNLANQAQKSARQLIDPFVLLANAAALAQAITHTVDNLTINPPKTLRTAREAIRQVNHAVLTQDAAKWIKWNVQIRDILDDHAAKGRLQTLQSYLDAWTQIAKGLSRIQ